MTKTKQPTKRIRRHSEPTAAIVPKPKPKRPQWIVPAKKTTTP